MPLQQSSLDVIVGGARVKHFPKSQILLYSGDEVNDVFIIKEGVVKLYDIDEHGNEKILHIVKSPVLIPYAFFSGSEALIKWFYGALTDCEVYVLSQADLRKSITSHPDILAELMQQFSQDVHELLVRLSSLGKTTSREKLLSALRFLLVCHAVQRPSGWWRVPFPVNHQLLADMIGVTRESVSIVIREIQDAGAIRNPKMTILEIDRAKLFALMTP